MSMIGRRIIVISKIIGSYGRKWDLDYYKYLFIRFCLMNIVEVLLFIK